MSIRTFRDTVWDTVRRQTRQRGSRCHTESSMVAWSRTRPSRWCTRQSASSSRDGQRVVGAGVTSPGSCADRSGERRPRKTTSTGSLRQRLRAGWEVAKMEAVAVEETPLVSDQVEVGGDPSHRPPAPERDRKHHPCRRAQLARARCRPLLMPRSYKEWAGIGSRRYCPRTGRPTARNPGGTSAGRLFLGTQASPVPYIVGWLFRPRHKRRRRSDTDDDPPRARSVDPG